MADESLGEITPRRLIELANTFGKKIFEVSIEVSDKYEAAGLEPHLADTIVRSGLEGALASFLGSMLCRSRQGEGVDPHVVIAKIAEKISSTIETFIIESGGSALAIDVDKPPDTPEEP